MFIQKIGYDHWKEWKNCQDSGFETKALKCVVDGCSASAHSEVGAQLFCHLRKEKLAIETIFEQFTSTFFTTDKEIEEYLLFTILQVEEQDDEFVVQTAGDGYILLQNHKGEIQYERLEYDDEPPYFAYNYIHPERMKKYKEGVQFEERRYPKSEYQNVGIASDGLFYVLRSRYREEFESYLQEKKGLKIKLLVNRVHTQEKDYRNQFLDDFTLVF